MTDRTNWRGRGLMVSVSAVAILALTAGSPQADCAEEIATLEQDIQHAEAVQPSQEGQQQQATAQPEQPAAPADQQQATAQPEQPAAPSDQQAMAQPEQPAAPSDQQATAQPEQPAAPADQQQAMAQPEQPAGSTDQQATAQPQQPAAPSDQQQATAQPEQPAAPSDQQQAEAPRLEEGTVRQQGMPRPNGTQAVRPPEGATTMGQPGEAATGALPGTTGPTGGETAERAREDTQAQEQQTAMVQQPSANHPLVLQMADGSVVDMRPPEEKEEAAPQAADQPAAAERQAGQQPDSAGEQQAEAAGREAVEGAEPIQPAATHGPAPAEPLWFTDEDTRLVVEASLDEAKAALQQGNEAACMEAIQEARASIEEFNMSGEEGQSSAPQQPERGGTAPR